MCCSCCWHEQQVSRKKGIPNFGDLELGSQNIYDTRLNGENLFSDFRWCHGELLLGMHGAADAAIAARYCLVASSHAPPAIKTACIPGLKECFYKQYAVPRVRRRHAYLTHPPASTKINTSYLCFRRSARVTPDGRLRSYNLYVIRGTLAQVRS